MVEIQLRNVCKRWGSFVGVDDFDLTITDREFLDLLGPSGCYKMTTMRIIAGLEDPSDGDIWIGDREVSNLEPKDRNVAMVFQSYTLYPNLNVYDNIRFPLKVRGIDPSTHDEKARRASAMVEFDEFLHCRPAELSGGQRQRVALARAIVREPNVFLMYEPVSNLYAKLWVSIRAQINNLPHELKVTTIYVTHDQIEAISLANRVVVMEKGVVQHVGSPTEIYDRPANTFVASFIGSPAMNLIDEQAEGGSFTAPATRINGLSAPDGWISLDFRAEDAQVVESGGEIKAPIYTLELLGDATMVTVLLGKALISMRTSLSAQRLRTGCHITRSSLDFWRIENGMIRECWVMVDLIDPYRQMDVDVFVRTAAITGRAEAA